MERYLEFKIKEQTAPVKIDTFLKKHAGLTKRQISQAKFRPDGITRNGIRCRVTETAYPGDVLRICLEEAQTASLHLESFSGSAAHPLLDILYEDEDLLAVNKPAGMVTHPTGHHYADSLTNLAASYFHQQNLLVRIRPVGRLDQETSGIVIFAKNQAAASRLQSVKSPSKIHKTYLAAVSGCLPVDSHSNLLSGTVESAGFLSAETFEEPFWHTVRQPLMQDPANHLKMKTAACLSSQLFSGKIKTAVTHYHTIFSSPNWALIALRLETGRTHQIRVHMASVGHPLLGDLLYNSVSETDTVPSFSRTALHAWKVSFRHPFRPEYISLEAPLPEDFRQLRQEASLPFLR